MTVMKEVFSVTLKDLWLARKIRLSGSKRTIQTDEQYTDVPTVSYIRCPYYILLLFEAIKIV